MMPTWVARFVGLVVPRVFRDDLLADLRDGFGRRGGGWRGARWLVREITRTPYVALWREAHRLGRTESSALVCRATAVAHGLDREPALAICAVLSLVVAVTSVSLVAGVADVLRPASVSKDGTMYEIWARQMRWRDSDVEVLRANWSATEVPGAVLEAIQAETPGVVYLAGFRRAVPEVSGIRGEEPAAIEGAWVTSQFFAAVGIAPLAGRMPTATELLDGAPVVVLGEELWRRRYGGRPEIVGDQIVVDGRPLTVIGVMPRSFSLPGETASWWAPVQRHVRAQLAAVPVFRAVARLRPGASPGRVAAILNIRIGALASRDDRLGGSDVRLEPLGWGARRPIRSDLFVLAASGILVALMSVGSFALLVSARAAGRSDEFTTRSALGAGPGALLQELTLETWGLTTAGWLMGVAVVSLSFTPLLGFFQRAFPAFPPVSATAFPVTAIGLASCVTAAFALALALCAALAMPRAHPLRGALIVPGRSRRGLTRRGQRALLFAETAVAALLMLSAGTLVRVAARVGDSGTGITSASLAYVDLAFPRRLDPSDPDSVMERLERALSAVPGVRSVGRAEALPGVGSRRMTRVRVEEDTTTEATLGILVDVSSGYLNVAGLEIEAGRGFRARDREASVVLLSQEMSRRLFHGVDAVGATVSVGQGTRAVGGALVTEHETSDRVVGIVSDVRYTPGGPTLPIVYTLGRLGKGDAQFVVRSDEMAADLPDRLADVVRATDPSVPVHGAGFVQQASARWSAPLRARTGVIGILGLVATLLTSLGVYAVVGYVVTQQRQELGVRLVCGSRSAREARRIIGGLAIPVLGGAIVGLVAGCVVGSRLVGMTTEPLPSLHLPTFIVSLALTLVPSAWGAWIATRRILTVDPARTLLVG